MKSLREKLFFLSIQEELSTNKIISSQLLKDFYNNKYSSMKELSEQIYVSPSSLTKFCQSLGYSGYRELMISLKHERESYSLIMSKTKKENMKPANFEYVENNITNALLHLKVFANDIKLISELINTSQTTFIYAGYQVQDSAEYLMHLLRIKKLEILLNNLRLTDLLQFSRITTDDLIIVLLAGQDNYFLVETLNNHLCSMHERPKIILLCTDSHKDKLKYYDIRIVYDYFMDEKKYYYRKLYLDYLVLQIFEHLSDYS